MAVKMHRHDAPGALRDQGLDGGRIEIHGHGIDVAEDGGGAEPRDGEGGKRGGHRRGDDLVARTDALDLEGEDERVGAVRHGDRVPCTHGLGELLLEGVDFGPEDEPAPIQHTGHGPVDGGAMGRDLGLQFVEGNRDRFGHR